MRRCRCFSIIFLALFAASSVALATANAARLQTQAAAAASQASPALIGALSKELGATPEQATGAAGALFSVAKSRLAPNDFSQVAKAVPGMDALLKAAPSTGGVPGGGALSQLGGSAAGLASAASAFSKLGLKPDLVAKAVPILVGFVTKSGGTGVGNLLAGALK